MINPKELNIGNLIMYKGGIAEVTGVLEDKVFFKKGRSLKYCDSPDNVGPIPFTEHRLVMLGFTHINGTLRHSRHNHIQAKLRNGVYEINICYAGGREAESESVEHTNCIHRLQNLYFELHNEYLDIIL